jgi:hypothetical protein
MGFQYEVVSLKGTHFTGAIAQNAAEYESITLLGALAGINGNARGQVRSITVISDENLDWEILLFRKNTFGTADLDADSFIGRWSFVAADAVRIAGAGSYYYYIDGLDVQYTDDDNTGRLHVALINRSAAAKTAGANGEVVLKVRLDPPAYGS